MRDGRCRLLRSIGRPGRRDGERVTCYLRCRPGRRDTTEGYAFSCATGRATTFPRSTRCAIAALLDRDPADATLPGVSLQAYGGAIEEVDHDASAFSHRETRF